MTDKLKLNITETDFVSEKIASKYMITRDTGRPVFIKLDDVSVSVSKQNRKVYIVLNNTHIRKLKNIFSVVEKTLSEYTEKECTIHTPIYQSSDGNDLLIISNSDYTKYFMKGKRLEYPKASFKGSILLKLNDVSVTVDDNTHVHLRMYEADVQEVVENSLMTRSDVDIL